MERKMQKGKSDKVSTITANLSNIKLNDPKPKEELDKMTIIGNSLKKVDSEINENIYAMASSMDEHTIILSFNQTALDFFNFAINGTKRLNREREFGFSGYLSLFQTAIKANIGVPIDKFTILILEYAPDIYSVNEKFFLNMDIPDIKIDVSDKKKNDNEFNMIQSEEFKKLWLVLSQEDKDAVKEKIILLTTYAHAYFFKLCMTKK